MGVKGVVLVDSDFGGTATERRVVEGAGLRFVDARRFEGREKRAAIREASALLVQYERIGEEILAMAGQLEVIVPYGVGTDMIDLAAARQAGVRVEPVTDYCVDEVADHTMALVLACLRDVPRLRQAVAEGEWPGTAELGDLRSLRECSFGIVGFGSIGRAVARRAAAAAGRVVAHDPHVERREFRAAGADGVSLEEVFTCDVVSLHVPLSDGTRHLVTKDLLRRLPDGAVLVNVARGEIIDEQALLEEASSGRLRVGVDVLTEEPPSRLDLVGLPNVVATPHAAWFSRKAEDRLRRRAAQIAVGALVPG